MPIVEVLTEYADKYGVALVNTIGNLTEYGKDLMRAIEASGGHAAILTDYKDYGLLIVASVLRSGVDIPRRENVRIFWTIKRCLINKV